jgi:signal transduction histidine kinase/DNA-binding response OmpR family regulator
LNVRKNSRAIEILLVEDNPGDARLLREMLVQANSSQVELTHVERLDAALQCLEIAGFDVLLLDLSLPDGQGLDTLIRAHAQAPHVPIIVITGLDDEVLAIEAVRQGAQDYLIKAQVATSNGHLLLRAIHYAIERKRAEEQIRRRNRELTLLNRVVATATSTLDAERVLQIVCRELTQVFELAQVSAALLNAEQTEVNVVAEYLTPGRRDGLGMTIPIAGNPVAEHMLVHKIPLAVTDAQTDTRMASLHIVMRERAVVSLLVVPMLVRGRVAGGLALIASERREFNQHEITLAQNVAAAAGQALETTRLYQASRRNVEQLQEIVARRTVELESALQQARSADRVKSEFVSNVSHELRTPLTNLKLYLGLLTRGQPDKHQTYMDTLHREVGRLQDLIEGLLDLSRLDLDKLQANLQPTDLNLLVGTLVADRSALVADRGLILDVELDEHLPSALADPQLIEQVLTNLLTNAINYTPGGGQIDLRTGVAEAAGQSWVTVDVADTGPGITEKDRMHLFERFYRGQAGRASHAPGTGLGLAICKEIMDRHSGRITLESQVGQGSTFTVWLAVAPKHPDSHPALT